MLLWKWVYKYLSEAVLILLGIYSEVWYWSHDSSIFNFLRNCYTVSWTSLVAQLKRICLQCRRPQFNSRVRKVPWRRDRLPTPVFLGLSGGSDNKESTCNVRDLGLNPGLGRSLGGGHGNPLQYSCLENPHGGLQSMGLQRVRPDWATFSHFRASQIDISLLRQRINQVHGIFQARILE